MRVEWIPFSFFFVTFMIVMGNLKLKEYYSFDVANASWGAFGWLDKIVRYVSVT